MTAGVTSITVAGVGAVQMWSSDGTPGGALSPIGPKDFSPATQGTLAALLAAVGNGLGPYAMTPLGYQQITSLSAATGLTIPATATFAIIEAQDVDVRWLDSGSAPTATVGMVLHSGVPRVFSGAAELAALQFIQTGGGTATLNISYYK